MGRLFDLNKESKNVYYFWRHDTQHNDTQHKDTQHIETQHIDTQYNGTQHIWNSTL